MKLGVSNLAWDASVEKHAFEMMQKYGATGLEVAPTRIADWNQLTIPILEKYKEKAAGFGLVTSSLQAILFNKPTSQLLGSAEEFEDLLSHMRQIGEIASCLGAKIAVFGAPGNRKRGVLDKETATSLALERMDQLGDLGKEYDFIIGIESVPEYYKCDFLTTIKEVSSFVRTLNNPFVKTHFDIACVTLGGDDPVEQLNNLQGEFCHYHIAEPDLGGYEDPKCNHAGASEVLSNQKYDCWAVVEMKQNSGDGLQSLETALNFATEVYFG